MNDISESTVRAEVRAWLEANWNPELGLIEWRNKLADSGWGALSQYDGVALAQPVRRPRVGWSEEDSVGIRPSASPRPAFACWLRRRSWRTAPTCRKPNLQNAA